MKKIWRSLFLISLPLATLESITPLTSVKAQITPDKSLGAESSVVNPNLTIRNIPSDRIDGGAIRGNNLFHSFQEFNVGAGRGAYFSNPGIENILTRVTGSNPSNILGTLGVLGNGANLFFINPNGIIFGPNAHLDVGGSFYASTASSLIFKNGFEFSATNPQAPPLLTIDIPIGLRFRDNPGGITVRGFGQNQGLNGASDSFNNPTLEVNPGYTLALVGGNVSLDGGVLQAPGGQVELGGLTAAGTVGINSNDGSLSFPPGVPLADVSLTNKAGINVITDQFGDGSININARNIGISGQSLLTAGIAENSGTTSNSAGDITLNATGETRIDQSRIENNVNSGTIADSSNINITTGSFVLTNGAVLDASNLGSRDRVAGDVKVNADGQVTIDRASAINSKGFFGRVFLTSSNNSVNISNSSITTTSNNNNNNPNQHSLIQVTAPNSSVYINNSTLNTSNSGTGFAGDIVFNTRDQVSLLNQSTIESSGLGGRILIGKNDFYGITSSPKEVILNGSTTLSTTNSSITGNTDTPINAGNISIAASDRIFINQSYVETFTSRRGNAGDVTLQAENGDISLTNSGGIFSTVEAGGIGNAGEINISAKNVSLIDGAQLQSSVNEGGQGSSGDVTLNAQGDVRITGVSQDGYNSAISTSVVESGANGKAGNIAIISQAGSILLDNNAILYSSNQNDDFKAGDITLNAFDQVDIKNQSRIYSEGNSGVIYFGFSNPNAPSTLGIPSRININDSNLSTTNSGTGFAGDIVFNARDQVSLNQSTIESSGLGGRILIGKNDVYGITSSPKEVSLNGSTLSTTNESVTGNANTLINAGDISIEALDRLFVVNGSTIKAFTNRYGNAGNVTLRAENGDILLADAGTSVFSTVESSGKGKGGDIIVQARNISLKSSAQIDASTFGVGNAGSVTLQAQSGDILLADAGTSVFSTVESSGSGKGGDIIVQARNISLKSGAQIDASTFGVGNAGSVTLQAQSGDISLAGAGSSVFSTVESSGSGKGGDIIVQARNLSLTGGARLVAQTLGKGDAGKITVNATDSIFLSGVAPYPVFQDYPGGFSSGLINTTEQGANGQGGEINVTTSKLQILDGAALNARSRSNFKGGDITVNADTLEVTGGGQILTTSFSSGDAGNITVNVSDRINIAGSDFSYGDRFNSIANAFPKGYDNFPDGETVARFTIDPVSSESGIFANTTSDSTARGGNLTINTRQLDVRDGATVTVSSPQGQAGNLTITAKKVNLDRGKLTAETAKTSPNEQGANITLQGLDLLSLRNNSLISAKASAGANGGNITINAANGFVVGFPGGDDGSDIVAKAERGSGGKITITALRIYGLAPGESVPGNRTNDIDTRSEFGSGGTININTSYVDPSQSLVELPETVVDPTTQIAQNPCQQGVGSTFVITGRGGLPSSPNQTLSSDNVRVGLVEPASTRGNSASKTAIAPSTKPTVKQIVPAQGWVFNDKGQVVLTAYDPTSTGSQRPWRTAASCAKR